MGKDLRRCNAEVSNFPVVARDALGQFLHHAREGVNSARRRMSAECVAPS